VYAGKIPGERALAAEFNVDFKTANRAVSLLVEQGILFRKRGEGTFVAPVGKRNITLGLCFYKSTDPGQDPVFTRFFAGMNQAAKAMGIRLDVTSLRDAMSDKHHQPTERFFELVMSAGPDGLLYLGNLNTELIKELEKQCPMIVVAQPPEKSNWHCVRRDVRQGTAQAVRRLAALGHQQIALVSYERGIYEYDLEAKESGYVTAIQELGQRPNILRIAGAAGLANDQVARALTKLSPRPTAVVATESTLGLAILRDAAACGIRIPDDLALISFDDGDVGALTQPAMSSIHAFGAELAQLAVNRLVALLEKQNVYRIDESIPCSYIERASTGKPQS
jgi:DNA-binding LacI/PurR family transcriptional regulator